MWEFNCQHFKFYQFLFVHYFLLTHFNYINKLFRFSIDYRRLLFEGATIFKSLILSIFPHKFQTKFNFSYDESRATIKTSKLAVKNPHTFCIHAQIFNLLFVVRTIFGAMGNYANFARHAL